ncbi:MAG: DUF547 domain-containing protein [Bacteroidetes bacterium]|nr:DUF547 domain-containing protein [Bacteroidota bacterium]
MIKLLNPIIMLLFIITCSNAQSNKFDHSIFDALLKEYVDESGMVNYPAFVKNQKFATYLKAIENADIIKLTNEDKLAFYINAYNATVIKNVLDHWPINSPMDVDGFFNKIKHTIAGKEITLDELEHQYTLKIEPVLSHFGLVCAAVSCPKIIRAAYEGESVFKQLEENGRIYFNDSDKNRLDRENNILYLSEIFKWFGKSFKKKYGSLKNTAAHFMNDEDRIFLTNNAALVKYLKYNWKLNTQTN